jgi:broad specificity phosphatase PhoE
MLALVWYMRIFCVRHAESSSNVSRRFPDEGLPAELTDRGLVQAKRVADVLSHVGVEAVYSSPMVRAKKTAEFISHVTHSNLFVDERLREAGLGRLAGAEFDEIRKGDPQWYLEYFGLRKRYGLEDFGSMVARMRSLVTDVHEKGAKDVVFVTHLEPIRAMVSLAIGLYGDFVRRFRVDNASVSIFEYSGEWLVMRALNWLPLDSYS